MGSRQEFSWRFLAQHIFYAALSFQKIRRIGLAVVELLYLQSLHLPKNSLNSNIFKGTKLGMKEAP